MNALHLITTESTESILRRLFDAEDAKRAELAEIMAQQRMARIDYADERGLLIRPSLEVIRKAVRSS